METPRDILHAARSILEHFDRSELFRFPDPDPENGGVPTRNYGFNAALTVFRFLQEKGDRDSAGDPAIKDDPLPLRDWEEIMPRLEGVSACEAAIRKGLLRDMAEKADALVMGRSESFTHRARFELQHGAVMEFSGRSMEEVVDAIRDNARHFLPFRGLVQPTGAEDER